MNRLSASLLVLGLAVSGTASAQSYGSYGNDPYARNARNTTVYPDRYGSSGAVYDYARVVRVDPVIERYANASYGNGQRCYQTTAPGGYDGYVRDDRSYGGYGNGGPYGNDPYAPRDGRYGTDTGRTVATVIGGIAGAVLGSKVGGGSGQVAASAIGTMVGGMAGRQIYENTQRRRYTPQGVVTVCDPEPVRSGYGNYAVNDGRVSAYDVTYEYAGRQFLTRTNYHPGDRIRVRVDVRPE